MSKAISRRAMLRGAGVALALPWLESLAPRAARGQAVAPPRTFVAMSFPCGVTPLYWRPPATGRGDAWSLSPLLAPLAPVKPYVNVLANVGNYGPFGGHIEPAYANLTAALLTSAKPAATSASEVTVGVSVDQLIAQSMGTATKVPSLQVGLSTLDSYADGLPPACSRAISWRTATEPLTRVVDPQTVFDQIVGAGDLPPASDPFAAQRRAKNKSVLD